MMPTIIKLEKNPQEWAGRKGKGESRPSGIEIKATGLYNNCTCLSAISPKGEKLTEISLKKQTWAKIIVAIGKELSQ